MIASVSCGSSHAAIHPCLYCGGAAFDLLFSGVRDRLRFVPGEREFWKCRGCGSAILHPFPKNDELVAFYPPVYSFTPELGRQSALMRFLVELEHRLFYHPQYEAQTRHVLRGTGWNGQRGLRLLDVGCGRGLRLPVFRRLGFEVQGADFQQEVVDFVQNKLHVPAVCTDMAGLPNAFPTQSFDLITAFYLLEHVTDVKEVLRGCFHLLKPGGWFIGAIPFSDGVQCGLFGKRWINVTEAPRHLSLPSHPGIERACREVGYDLIRYRPDSVLNCAGMVGSSILPGAALTDAYGGGRLSALLRRMVGGVITLLAVPLVFFENAALRWASLGMVLAHKPLRPDA